MGLENFSEIDVVKNIDPHVFQEKYLKTETPVLLRGLWNQYPAQKKWTVQYFKDQLGNIEVGVHGEGKADRAMKKPDRLMKFGDYLELMASNEPSNLKLFLFDIFKYKKELKHDFGYPPLTSLYLKRFPFMFFGCKDTVVRLHQDIDWSNVFLTQLYGRKSVVLFSPRYSKLLYRFPFNVHSAVNIDKPDYHTFPGLRYVQGMRCIMEPGDTLFMPSGYWHYIKYLEGGFAINQRALSPYASNWLRGIKNVLFLSNLDELLLSTLGKNWFEYKKIRSQTNAEKEIREIERNMNSVSMG
jgi:hypothetical protein